MRDQIVEGLQRFLLAAALDHFLGDTEKLRPPGILGIAQVDLALPGIERADPIALVPLGGVADHAIDGVGAARQREAAGGLVGRHHANQIVGADHAIRERSDTGAAAFADPSKLTCH